MARPAQIRLASASPRRKSLLRAAGFLVDVVVPVADETWPGGTAEAGALLLARRKLAAVPSADAVTVAADTLVFLDDQPLGKPAGETEAIAMLTALSAREQRVVTGYCVSGTGGERHGAVTTRVTFRALGGQEIRDYVASGEPFGKAGAYAIQGLGGALIDQIHGSYTNVIGLPLADVIAAVEAVG